VDSGLFHRPQAPSHHCRNTPDSRYDLQRDVFVMAIALIAECAPGAWKMMMDALIGKLKRDGTLRPNLLLGMASRLETREMTELGRLHRHYTILSLDPRRADMSVKQSRTCNTGNVKGANVVQCKTPIHGSIHVDQKPSSAAIIQATYSAQARRCYPTKVLC
jgi:hypothetical protein